MARGIVSGTKAPPGSMKDKNGTSRPSRTDSLPSTAFVFTNAQPHDDLYVPSRSRMYAREETARPRTATSPQQKTFRESFYSSTPKWQSLDMQRDSSHSGLSNPPDLRVPTYTEEMGIGMALGSPSQIPASFTANKIQDSTSTLIPAISTYKEQIPSELSAHRTMEEGIKQKGRWKMFGGIFGKKMASTPTSPASSFYNLQYPTPDIVNVDPKSPRTQKALGEKGSGTREQQLALQRDLDQVRAATRKKVLSKKQKREVKPDTFRSRAIPFSHDGSGSPVPPPKDERGGVQLDTKPTMLRVDIPDVSMDRYSIMFSQVLKPEQPSLMVRRQAQLGRLKTVDSVPQSVRDFESKESLHIPIRRATSPSPRSLSPSFSLFPAALSSAKRTPSPLSFMKASPLHRSATAPDSLSPARAAFETSKSSMRDRSHPLAIVHSPTRSSDTPISAHNPKWSSDMSASTDASPIDDSDPDYSLAGKIIPISKFSSSARSDSPFRYVEPIVESSRPPRSHKSSSTRSENPTPSTNSRHVANPLSSAPPSAAEISIARQISVSRRQQLLVPIKPRTVRQPMQPTLVDVSKHRTADGSGDGRAIGHVSRKSEHALLEFA
ncbi:hypothetical protein MMC13_001322 [Lambiella insularis]|nr:hypothetical protein [Lambiella insularis]